MPQLSAVRDSTLTEPPCRSCSAMTRRIAPCSDTAERVPRCRKVPYEHSILQRRAPSDDHAPGNAGKQRRHDRRPVSCAGADEGTRTPDLRITSAVLCQLSYVGIPSVRAANSDLHQTRAPATALLPPPADVGVSCAPASCCCPLFSGEALGSEALWAAGARQPAFALSCLPPRAAARALGALPIWASASSAASVPCAVCSFCAFVLRHGADRGSALRRPESSRRAPPASRGSPRKGSPCPSRTPSIRAGPSRGCRLRDAS